MGILDEILSGKESMTDRELREVVDSMVENLEVTRLVRQGKCKHIWGHDGDFLYSEHDLHDEIAWSQKQAEDEMFIFDFCPNCGKQLVK